MLVSVYADIDNINIKCRIVRISAYIVFDINFFTGFMILIGSLMVTVTFAFSTFSAPSLSLGLNSLLPLNFIRMV